MKAIFTAAALADLEDIIAYTKQNFPGSASSLEQRIRSVIARIEQWPESGRQVAERSGVRVVPLVRYPFRIFIGLQKTRFIFCIFTTPRGIQTRASQLCRAS